MSRRSHRERHRPNRYGDWDLRSKSSSTASSTSSIRRRKAQLELEAAEQLAQLGQREIDLQRQLIQKRLELAQEELDEATRLPLPPSESASTRSRLSDERLNEWIADQQLQPTEQQPTGGEQPIVKVETPRQVDLDLQTAQPELVHRRLTGSSRSPPVRHLGWYGNHRCHRQYGRPSNNIAIDRDRYISRPPTSGLPGHDDRDPGSSTSRAPHHCHRRLLSCRIRRHWHGHPQHRQRLLPCRTLRLHGHPCRTPGQARPYGPLRLHRRRCQRQRRLLPPGR